MLASNMEIDVTAPTNEQIGLVKIVERDDLPPVCFMGVCHKTTATRLVCLAAAEDIPEGYGGVVRMRAGEFKMAPEGLRSDDDLMLAGSSPGYGMLEATCALKAGDRAWVTLAGPTFRRVVVGESSPQR